MAELLARVSSRELTEWMAFASLEPFGPLQDDSRAGVIAATVANVHRDPKKGRPLRPEQFFPSLKGGGKRERRQSPQQQLAIIEMWNAALGGKDLRKR